MRASSQVSEVPGSSTSAPKSGASALQAVFSASPMFMCSENPPPGWDWVVSDVGVKSFEPGFIPVNPANLHRSRRGSGLFGSFAAARQPDLASRGAPVLLLCCGGGMMGTGVRPELAHKCFKLFPPDGSGVHCSSRSCRFPLAKWKPVASENLATWTWMQR